MNSFEQTESRLKKVNVFRSRVLVCSMHSRDALRFGPKSDRILFAVKPHENAIG